MENQKVCEEFVIINYELIRYNGDNEDVVIPDGVMKVAADAFFNKKIKTLTIPKSLIKIDGTAFYNCNNLEKLIVEEGHPELCVKGNCVINAEKNTLILGLKNSVIPDDGSVKKIGKEAFTANGFDSGIIPDGVTAILSYAFAGAEMKKIVIPSSVSKIGVGAFNFCELLETVEIPEGVKSIGNKAFSYCGMTSVKLPQSLTQIGEEAFGMCKFLEEINIPLKLKKLGSLAFDGCESLKCGLFIPATLTGLDSFTFSSFESITVEEGNPEYIGKGNCLIEKKSKQIIFGCPQSVIPDDGSVKSIAPCAFSYCRGLKNLVIPERIKEIGSDAFSHCKDIESVVIPKSVTAIGHGAFWYCENLKTVTVPKIYANRNDLFYGRKDEKIEYIIIN